MSQIEALVKKLISELSVKNPYLVAIDGIGGSGKSTLARNLHENIPNTQIISLDDFRSEEVYEVDFPRLLNEVLIPLSKGKNAKYRKWLWGEKRFSDYFILHPRGLIIIEGVTALHPSLSEFYDFKIWVDCDNEKAFERGVKRDLEDYGVNSKVKWLNEWVPFEQEYIKKYSPRNTADFVYLVE